MEALRLRVQGLHATLDQPREGAGALVHTHAWPRPIVAVPPLGEAARAAFATRESREPLPHVHRDETEYAAYPSSVYTFRDAILHGRAGLLGLGDVVVGETTWHTAPETHGYARDGDAIVLDATGIRRLPGRSLSLLAAADNYWHSVIDGVARLALVPDAMLDAVDRVLLPDHGVGQADLMRLYRLPESVPVQRVAGADTLLAEELVFPTSLHGVFDYHPRMNAFFDRVVAHTGAGRTGRERIYVDRRGSPLRVLRNEDEVVAALADLGFAVVRLEELGQEEQIATFRDAEVVVSPHGAGLTNLGFSRPGTVVIELMMDAYLNWCYRRHAAIRGLRYDCVLGRAVRPWNAIDPAFHSQRWDVSVAEVVEAVRALAPMTRPARPGRPGLLRSVRDFFSSGHAARRP